MVRMRGVPHAGNSECQDSPKGGAAYPRDIPESQTAQFGARSGLDSIQLGGDKCIPQRIVGDSALVQERASREGRRGFGRITRHSYKARIWATRSPQVRVLGDAATNTFMRLRRFERDRPVRRHVPHDPWPRVPAPPDRARIWPVGGS